MKKPALKIPKPNKKFIFLVIIIILLIASQLWSVRMVYGQKFKGQTAIFIAKVYHLPAGQIINNKDKITISLADYLGNLEIGTNYAALSSSSGSSQQPPMSPADVSDSMWQKVLQEAWIKNFAKQHGITVTQPDINDSLKDVKDVAALKKSVSSDFKVSFGTYQELILKPMILEAKVYQYLLENFNDMAGMKKAQAAYDALVKDKRSFKAVADQYADDQQYVDNSLFLKDSELGSFGGSIRDLQPGEYSKIVILPGNPAAYVIWRLQGKTVDSTTKENVFELRGFAITAKSMDQFIKDYLSASQINRWY